MRKLKLKNRLGRRWFYETIFELTPVECTILLDLIDHRFYDETGWTFNRKNIPDARGKKAAQFNNTLVKLRKKKVLGTKDGKNYIPDIVLSNDSFKIEFEDDARL